MEVKSVATPCQNDSICYVMFDNNQRLITNCSRYNYDQGGFSGGIRAKGLQNRLRKQIYFPRASNKVIKKAKLQETLAQTLPKNPLLNFIHNAELLLMNILSCRIIR